MTNLKATKRALLASIMSIILCCSMLLGTTFAWFTDTATNTNNRILAGNLKVDLLMWDGDDYISIKDYDTGDIFNMSNDIAQNDPTDTLWEPGKTQVVYLAVQNDGNLALKYDVQLRVIDKGLASALEFTILEDVQPEILTDANSNFVNDLPSELSTATWTQMEGTTYTTITGNGTLEKAKDIDYFALAVHMKEDSGNIYQNKDVIIDIAVLATQMAAENDANNNNNYDEEAEFPNSPLDEIVKESIEVVSKDDGTGVYTTTTEKMITSSTTGATAIIPKGVRVEPNTTELTLNIKPSNETPNITVESGMATQTLEISIEGIHEENTVPVTIKTNIGVGLDATNLQVYHKDTLMTASDYSYDAATGMLTIKTPTFSPFTYVYNEPTGWVTINNNVYYNVLDYAVTHEATTNATKGTAVYQITGEMQIKAENLQFATSGVTEVKLIGSDADEDSINMTANYRNTFTATDAKVTLENLTIYGAHGNNHQDTRNIWITANELVANKVVFKDPADASNVKKATFDECTFEDDYAYSLWIGNHDPGYHAVIEYVSVTNSTFNGPRAIKMATTDASSYTAIISNNTFNSIADKPAICLNYGTQLNTTTITNNTTINCEHGLLENELSDANATATYLTVKDNTVAVTIDSKEELLAFAEDVNVNGNTYANKTVLLTADIDLKDVEWTPIGDAIKENGTYFKGTFDGLNYTIANLAAPLFGNINSTVQNLIIDGAKIEDEDARPIGVVGYSIYNSGLIDNVTVKNATVLGNGQVGGIVGSVYGKITNCTVKDSSVTALPSNDNGDKIGGIVGLSQSDNHSGVISGNTVENVTIKGYRDIGGIVGAADGYIVTDNKVVNTTITADPKTHDYGHADAGKNCNEILGRNLDNSTLATSNTATKTSVVVLVEGLTLNEDGSATAANDNALDAAINGGIDKIELNEGNYIIPDSAQGKTLTIIGNGDTVVATQDDGSYEGCDYSLDGATVTFEGITINTDSTTYTGYARLNATYKNCTINGTYTLYGNSVFDNCTFNVSGDVYNIWTWGAPNATFNDCTFNSDGKALLLYGTENTNLKVNDCVFNDNGGLTDLKAAIEIGNDYGKSYTLTVNNTTVNGYEINDKGISTGTTLWANKNSMGTDNLNVVVDGVDVY